MKIVGITLVLLMMILGSMALGIFVRMAYAKLFTDKAFLKKIIGLKNLQDFNEKAYKICETLALHPLFREAGPYIFKVTEDTKITANGAYVVGTPYIVFHADILETENFDAVAAHELAHAVLPTDDEIAVDLYAASAIGVGCMLFALDEAGVALEDARLQILMRLYFYQNQTEFLV